MLVPALTLDTLLDSVEFPPTFVKVDVEGGELGVLEGAKRLLKDVRPIFYVEVGSAQSLEVTEQFVSNNYLLFKDAGAEQLIDKCVFNTLAVPREKHQKG